MMCMVSPALEAFAESLSTLKFANRCGAGRPCILRDARCGRSAEPPCPPIKPRPPTHPTPPPGPRTSRTRPWSTRTSTRGPCCASESAAPLDCRYGAGCTGLFRPNCSRRRNPSLTQRNNPSQPTDQPNPTQPNQPTTPPRYERELRKLRAELQRRSKELVDKRRLLEVGLSHPACFSHQPRAARGDKHTVEHPTPQRINAPQTPTTTCRSRSRSARPRTRSSRS